MNDNENDNIVNEFNNMFGEKKEKEVVEPYKAVSNNNFNQFNSQNQTFGNVQQVSSNYVNQSINNISENVNNVNQPINNTFETTTNLNQTISSNQPIISDIINSNQPDVQNIIMPEVNNLNNSNNILDVNATPLYDTTNSINDVKVERKVKKNKIKISKDMQTIIILAAILLLVILILPFIFDLFDNLKNSILG